MRLVAIVCFTALFVVWGWIARWTEFRCDADRCVHTERRTLTFPFQREIAFPRKELAAHPERIRVVVTDVNRRGANIVIDHDGRALRVDEGHLEDMNVRAAALRASIGGVAPIAARVSPHPFGFAAMGLLGLILAIATHGLIRARSRASVAASAGK